ncbi:related to S.fumigata Asp FII [Cephalotrichum gorgonifer]|uniref:Related to S.fumigata Asp FII n=1 Tax=Cephalotrichum gorgonifer TaxID=2041049 RepID=A0AAE8N533_9PEZI|nr:related to S.fumigata Asp FII [Cephalotrichum gorgonifer]
MKLAVFSVTLLSQAFASPVVVRETTETFTHEAAWSASTKLNPPFPIHESCNSTLSNQLSLALEETVVLARHAKEHILRWGNKSPFVEKYFGNGTTAAAVGVYERVVSADRGDMLFRCDDPDKNCVTQNDWAGHWRGENATAETVICDASFRKRRWLSSLCGGGYTVVQSPLNTYWAVDLLHRLLHVPNISEGVVEHFAEDYAGILELAKEGKGETLFDSDALQYFAVDVYAYDIAAPGVGCSGEIEEK